jgi:hypothetical protein
MAKYLCALLLCIGLASQVFAYDLVLTDGRTLKGIKLRSMDALGVTLIHEGGGDYVDYLSMSEPDRVTFGYVQSRYDAAIEVLKNKRSAYAADEATAKTAARTTQNTPPVSAPAYSAPAASTPRAASSGQCAATTKKGTRCSRNAAAGSSYCWQHP